MEVNFNESIDIGMRSRKLIIIVYPVKTKKLRIILSYKTEFARIIGKEAITRALSGVGSPRKEDFCDLSRLNLANRIAENIVTRNAR